MQHLGVETIAFSIIVPTFRREDLLGPLFAAVQAQLSGQTGSVELLVIDNSPEASARDVTSKAPGFVRYVHEPRTGVAQARNRGLTEAAGAYIIFLDDDQIPDQGWLAAFMAAAAGGTKVGFGSIEPTYAARPPEHLSDSIARVFSRQLPAASGQDVSQFRAYLGSGNSMFYRDVLALETPAFDPAFDGGGEDVWLLRKLVDRHGVALIWIPKAAVHEIVPGQRTTMGFLRRRRFSNGQLRCVVESGAEGLRGGARVALWMAIGAVQLVVQGALSVALWPVSRRHSVRFQLAAVGGAGKLLWWLR